MINKDLDQIRQQIINETDGSKFSKLVQKFIKKYESTEREHVLNTLMEYARSGQLLHWRNFLLTDIIKLVEQEEVCGIDFFEWCVTQPELMYWGIDGVLKVKGKKSYPTLVDLIKNESLETSIRAKSIKSISVYSGHAFDRDLPKDPGYWKLEQLRITEIETWQKKGYQDGQGYTEPNVHISLLAPKTKLEKTVAKLNKKLEVRRNKNQDLSNPSDWLVIADETDILSIEKKWELPESYLLFLKNYSPLNVMIDNPKYFQGLHLYGAADLIKNQAGYSFNPVTKQYSKDWPTNLVVIADSGADPYCLDIAQIKDQDAPIYTSVHGTGKWEFELYAASFLDFLNEIAGK